MQLLRKILFPFSVLYRLILVLRNYLYDISVLSSKQYPFPVICVGNLSLGGTGKSPTIEYLIRLLKKDFSIATLSRGYKRKTTGFMEVKTSHFAHEVGDEPLQFKTNFPDIKVAVDEVRTNGIEQLRKLYQPEVILLDDAYQHRKVTPGFSILLTAYDSLYVSDFVLPTGNLREPISGAKRANIILVTKCPSTITAQECKKIERKLKPKPHQKVFFSTIEYDEKIHSTTEVLLLKELQNFNLVTGIANPDPLLNHLNQLGKNYQHHRFADHHNFTKTEIETLQKEDLIVTTEKDFMRLQPHFSSQQLYYLPIRFRIIEGESKFNKMVMDFCKKK
ncbi:MAG: tetraacyldisaccharide 4'-kinase [Bacteroidota bacterium]